MLVLYLMTPDFALFTVDNFSSLNGGQDSLMMASSRLVFPRGIPAFEVTREFPCKSSVDTLPRFFRLHPSGKSATNFRRSWKMEKNVYIARSGHFLLSLVSNHCQFRYLLVVLTKLYSYLLIINAYCLSYKPKIQIKSDFEYRNKRLKTAKLSLPMN